MAGKITFDPEAHRAHEAAVSRLIGWNVQLRKNRELKDVRIQRTYRNKDGFEAASVVCVNMDTGDAFGPEFEILTFDYDIYVY